MSDAAPLLLGLLDIAGQLETLLGAEWPPVRDALLTLAGRLEQRDDRASVQRELDTLIDGLLTTAPPEAQALVRGVMRAALADDGTELPRHRSPGIVERRETRALGNDAAGAVVLPVYYATDRKHSGDDAPSRYYTSTFDTPAFGVARVNVPVKARAVGELTGPRWWRLEFREDPAKHVILLSVEPHDRDAFVHALRDSLGAADAQDALLFVHGYNVSFEDAARRAAQIAVDLRFAGRTLLYSWASAADPKKYTVDEETIDLAREHFGAFLQLALTEIGARRVHVIAHSMGNRAVMNALERLDPSMLPAGSATLSQVIFAAPDINATRFRQLANVFHGRAGRYTLYASSRDLALKASKVVHGYPRAGEAGATIEVVAGVDTIDASNVDTSLLSLGHSYFGSKRSILRDISDLIEQGLEPGARFELQEAGSDDRRYWQYRE